MSQGSLAVVDYSGFLVKKRERRGWRRAKKRRALEMQAMTEIRFLQSKRGSQASSREDDVGGLLKSHR
jgi:hypothetical protein